MLHLHYIARQKKSQKLTQPAFTCSKLKIETLEQGGKYGLVLVSLLLTLNIFHTLF